MTREPRGSGSSDRTPTEPSPFDDPADLRTTGSTPFAGAITAALFLQKFVDKTTPWAHVDLMGWNRCHRPGRPKGGEVMAARGVLETIRARSTRHREAS